MSRHICISLQIYVLSLPIKSNDLVAMILSSQLRAARALIDLSQEGLSEASAVSISTVRDFEAGRRHPTLGSLDAMQRVLEKKGVRFISPHGETGPGVYLEGEMPRILRMPTKINIANDTLVFDVKWREETLSVFVPTTVVDDLGETNYKVDKEYVEAFTKHKATILQKTVLALYAGRADKQRRLRLRSRDFWL